MATRRSAVAAVPTTVWASGEYAWTPAETTAARATVAAKSWTAAQRKAAAAVVDPVSSRAVRTPTRAATGPAAAAPSTPADATTIRARVICRVP